VPVFVNYLSFFDGTGSAAPGYYHPSTTESEPKNILPLNAVEKNLDVCRITFDPSNTNDDDVDSMRFRSLLWILWILKISENVLTENP
jgi:hypothetical protein